MLSNRASATLFWITAFWKSLAVTSAVDLGLTGAGILLTIVCL
jgi:hypothetical protein